MEQTHDHIDTAAPRNGRLAHRARLLGDRHAWTALAVAGAACVFSFGLVYVGYFLHVLRTARRAPSRPAGEGCLLVFGKHAPGGRVDADFRGRLRRAAHVWRQSPSRPMVLLGGGFGIGASEAELARRGLLDEGVTDEATCLLESGSRDTLQNLRNARVLLCGQAGAAPVVLLSSRYHLARCALFAGWLGYEHELCAAEPALRWTPLTLWRIACESACVCWVDLGARWARLVGDRAMLARIA
ncbi:YdcF family protein [Luteimonas kalidii]|uniref:YdcF family protein n=1 Tax=Luteimonas kalidii TaxID=3042025 RepID=A0ABT6JRC4_9GAMM|nr:YdcF family protein [Luteimonas kalidii]MDH5833238.1 YdcF family protein [Luteimonas kalidii]